MSHFLKLALILGLFSVVVSQYEKRREGELIIPDVHSQFTLQAVDAIWEGEVR